MVGMQAGSGFRHRLRHILQMLAAGLAAAYFCLCISMRLTVRDTSCAEGVCGLYYLVNADGMKGLGHSVVMLVDEEGCGTVFSFNGMQRSLGECLLGKSGVGKLSMGTMTKEETDSFLRTGDLNLEGDQLQDNYDAALYRPITGIEYEAVWKQTAPYIEAEEQFLALYEKWAMEEDSDRKEEYRQAMEVLGEDESLPLYHIYTNNCDSVARELISAADPAMDNYMRCAWRMTPNGNLKAFGKQAGDWGVMLLGEQTLWEKLLLFFVSF